MIANKWYCIAQTGTFDSGCTINVSFDSYVIQFSASVKYGSSAINITRCELPLSANLSLRLRESNGLWSVDLLSNNDITPEIVVADSPYWVAVNSVAGAGNIILTLKDISKDFNTETGGGGGGLNENELRAFLDKYGYTQARDFWKYETTGGGAIHTDYHIIVDGGGAFGGAELGGGGESGGGGISEFYIQLGEDGQKYKLGNSGLPNVVQIPKYPVVPTNVSAFFNDAGYIGGEQAALIFSRISDVEGRVEKLEKLWWVDENGNLHTTYNIVVEGGGAFGTGASVDVGGSGGLGRVVLINDSGAEYASDENGIVRIPDYIAKTWFDAQKFATQSWVLSKGYVSESVLAPIREDITALKGDVAELKTMWTIKDGKLYTTYSIVVEGGGAFGQGASDSGVVGVGKTILITPSGLRYETNDDGYVSIPEWASQDWVNGKGFATQTWVLNKGFLTENSADLLYAKRAELDDINETLAELVKMWRLEDGKLFTDYSIVVKGGGSFGEGSESGGGSTGGLGQITIRNQAGQEYKTDANGVVVIPTYLTSTALDGYATQQWVESKKYLTSIPAEYITETELTAKGYAVASDIAETYATIESLNTTNTNLATVTTGLANVATTVNALSKNFVNGIAKEAAKVSHALTFGSKTYDGSIARTILASDLDAVTLSGEQIITGAKTFGSLITANGGIKIPYTASLKIGDITLVEENGALKVLGNLVVTGGGAFGTGSTSGGGTSGGLGSVTIRTEGGIEYKSNSNGVVTVPNWITASALNGYAKLTDIPSLSGYATESFVTSKGYITADSLTKANVGLGNVQNFGVFNQGSFKGQVQYALVNNSILEIGNRIDFHIIESASNDYEVSLRVASGEVTKRVIYLPSAEGTLALVSQIPTIPTALKSPYALTFGTKTYDGSEAKTITAADLGALSTGGGTISKSSYVPLVIQNTASDLSTILYKGTSGDLGYLGFNGASNPIYMAPSGNAYTLYHTGNFNPANYLPLSGGTLTGNLTVNGAISTAGSATIGGVIVTNSGRLRVNTSNSANSFGYLKATAYTSSLNRAVLDIGSNYGGSSNITSESVDVTALSIYRGVIGVGRAYSYDELYANYNSNTKLYVDGGIANTRTHAASHWDALKIISSGSWSSAPNYVNGIGVTDGSGIVGRFGISFNGTEGGYFSIRDLYTNAGGYASSGEIFKVVGNGNVYINGNLIANGGGAFGSDVRYKDIINYTNIDLATIANAPLFTYKWNDREDKKVYLGTSAQYWMDTNFKDAVNTTNKDFYHLDYGALGVGLAIATARKVVNHEERIATLEKENRELKEKLNKYETLWHN